jgi:type II secretory pathway predicted ATPase ExeA
MATRHRHALTMLEYVLHEASGFALITGEVGCGKTTVVRHFLDRLDGALNVGFITNTHPGIGSLLPWIAESLGLDAGKAPGSELYRRFLNFLLESHAAGRRTVLVIDEAQNLSVAGLEELRVLTNLNSGKDLLLQTILIGQPELRDTLRLQSLRQFAQRIAIDYHIEALQRDETQAYVRHRLEVAGGSVELFTSDAIECIHESVRGVPRLINTLCDTALVYGYAEQSAAIGLDIVELVIRDRVLGGLLPMQVAPKSVQGTLTAN